MKRKRVLLIGSTGFVGKNVSDVLSEVFDVFLTSRDRSVILPDTIYFDLTDYVSYSNVIDNDIDIIINCAGYGVVKTENDTNTVYTVNYLATAAFYDFLSINNPLIHIVHIGSAFEYDLSAASLEESGITLPKTHYGISKLMASKYLLEKKPVRSFIILRPFSMFGPYEHHSKIIPALILSQKNRRPVALSSGMQKRDYFFVGDLANYIKIILFNLEHTLPSTVINIGSGVSNTIRSLAATLSAELPYFKPDLWQWGGIVARENESDEFYNKSVLAFQSGLNITPLKSAFKSTIDYYWNL